MKPVSLERYIRLVTNERLDPKESKLWFQIVKTHGPQSVIGSITQKDPNGEPVEVQMISKEFTQGSVYYDIPLTRNLLEDEVQMIVDVWVNLFEGDFNIETSDDVIAYTFDEPTMDEEEQEQVAHDIAKAIHTRWYHKQQHQGWKFGVSFNQFDKTHPMLLPWEQLPSQYKDIDPQLADDILDIYKAQEQ